MVRLQGRHARNLAKPPWIWHTSIGFDNGDGVAGLGPRGCDRRPDAIRGFKESGRPGPCG